MKLEDVKRAREKAYKILKKARIAVTPREKDNMEVVDFGLNDLDHYGIEVVVYETNDRYCAKELALFPRQICPEHYHPAVDHANIGKQETFRCRWGEVYLYVKGEPTPKPKRSCRRDMKNISRSGTKSSSSPATSTRFLPIIFTGSRPAMKARC